MSSRVQTQFKNNIWGINKNMSIYGWDLQHALLHPWKCVIEETYYRLKWFIQRGFRGYADRDVWSIDGYLNSWLPAALKTLKKNKLGYPAGLKSRKQWDIILQKIIEGLESNREWGNLEFNFRDKKKLRLIKKKSKIGLQLLAEHYNNLWD